MDASAAVDWSAIETVLLDMDGTLLDLAFDNWFWQELIPSRYARRHGLATERSRAVLAPKFHAVAGTLDWYCIDHWTRELDLDVGAIKRAAAAEIRYLAGAEEFLLRLRALGGRRLVLVTNAHPEALKIKDERVALRRHFDAVYSSHPFAAPKEQPEFWRRLRGVEPFVAARTLLVDDNPAVLETACRCGIGWVRAVRRPDSRRPPRDTADFAAVDGVLDLL